MKNFIQKYEDYTWIDSKAGTKNGDWNLRTKFQKKKRRETKTKNLYIYRDQKHT